MSNCYCGRPISYVSCCGKIHQEITNAKTAEDLMRSRYSAFVIADGDYLLKSHHSSTRPSIKEKKEIVDWTKSVQWIKLDVLNSDKGRVDDTKGTVEFKASYFVNGTMEIIHEHSKFVKENANWMYVGAL